MARKSTIEKLKTRISVLEKDRQRKVDEQIELILKTDPDILQINAQIDDLKKMVKASEELERKKEELEKQMLDLLDQWEVAVVDGNKINLLKLYFTAFQLNNELYSYADLARYLGISTAIIKNVYSDRTVFPSKN